MSTPDAEQVVADTVEEAHTLLAGEIEAIFLLGSLAHGGFAPRVSDVDVAIVLTSTGPDTAARLAEVQKRVLERASSPLSQRLSLFWADWRGVRTGAGPHDRLGPVDRLDLLDSGRLLVGSDRREPSVRPSRRELVLMSADHILNRFSDDYLDRLADTRSLLEGGARTVTKAVLFPVRFTYTLDSGLIGFNDTAARWYGDEGLPGSALALAALDWRDEGIGDEDLALALLDAELGVLHVDCFGRYARELDRLGDPRRAAALASRAARVHVVSPDPR